MLSKSSDSASSAPSDHADSPRYEPWLGVAGSSMLPVLAMFLLPEPLMYPMIVLSAALFATALVMLSRQRRRATASRADD